MYICCQGKISTVDQPLQLEIILNFLCKSLCRLALIFMMIDSIGLPETKKIAARLFYTDRYRRSLRICDAKAKADSLSA